MKKKFIIGIMAIMLLAVALIGGAYASGNFGNASNCPQNTECKANGADCSGSCAGCPSKAACGGAGCRH